TSSPADGTRASIERAGKAVVRHSTLAWELFQRADLIRRRFPVAADAPRPAPPPAETDSLASLVPRAVVRALSRAFHERLSIIFVGTVPASGPPEDVNAAALASACA